MAEEYKGVRGKWRWFKARMKRTWIGWLYISARQDWLGNILLLLLVFTTGMTSYFIFEQLANRELASWDELECREGAVVKVFRPPRNQRHSTVEIVDKDGIKHSYLGGMYEGIEENLKAMHGEMITVCSRPYYELWLPFYYQRFERLEAEGVVIKEKRLSPFEEKEFGVKWLRGYLWASLIPLVWLLKRFGHQAWVRRNEYLNTIGDIRVEQRDS